MHPGCGQFARRAVPRGSPRWYTFPVMRDSDRNLLRVLVLSAAAIAVAFYAAKNAARVVFAPTPSSVESGITAANVPALASGTNETPKGPVTVADRLRIPWAVIDAGGGALLVTERPGTLRRIAADGSSAAYPIADVEAVGEGGLLGMTEGPPGGGKKWLYLYMTAQKGKKLVDRVVRYSWTDAGPVLDRIILDDIPAYQYHDGGTVAFGPDGMLYVTTGDAGDTANAQDRNALAGKILRLTPEGGIPADNPFGNATWSYGHRNPQGLAWDDEGRLWATEHGRSGVTTGYDELNLIVKGGNYGWPVIQGDQMKEGMIAPVVNSGPTETWAPSGLAWYRGKLFFAGLRGESLYEATPTADGKVTGLRADFRGEFGRLRAVTIIGGRMYLTTSNTDGRGTPREGDDRIIAVDPGIFFPGTGR